MQNYKTPFLNFANQSYFENWKIKFKKQLLTRVLQQKRNDQF